MYPFIRLAKEFLRHRKAPPLGLFEEHRATHICWPWDIDPFLELNNGRTLTLYDLGRFLHFRRVGALDLMRQKRWVGTIAGISIRYRRRVRAFDRYELRTRLIGWDSRFFYFEQGMWRRGECTSHGLLRMALTSSAGLVPTADCAAAFGVDPESPPLPDWVQAWADAEAQRPWPPMQEPPMQDPPVQEPTAQAPAMQEPPVQEPPVQEPPVQEPPKQDPPKQDPPMEEPRMEEPRMEVGARTHAPDHPTLGPDNPPSPAPDRSPAA